MERSSSLVSVTAPILPVMYEFRSELSSNQQLVRRDAQRERRPAERPRLDIQGFLESYQWVNRILPEDIGRSLEDFVCERVIDEYPEDVVDLYRALANQDDRRMRVMAAIGVYNVRPERPCKICRR